MSVRIFKVFKVCKTCNKSKPAQYYYKNPTMADGRENKCMECKKAERRERHRVKKIVALRQEKSA